MQYICLEDYMRLLAVIKILEGEYISLTSTQAHVLPYIVCHRVQWPAQRNEKDILFCAVPSSILDARSDQTGERHALIAP
jgi:hypothetical protein